MSALGLGQPSAAAADTPAFWSIQLENDALAGKEDRFYTGGLEISRAGGDAGPRWLEGVADAMPFYRQGDTRLSGWSVGFKVFNPEDQDTTELVVGDRPYAGWTYLEGGIADVYRRTERSEAINALVLTAGIVGPHSFARDIQDRIHVTLGVDLSNGWAHQLHDEPGVMGSYIRKWRYLAGVQQSRQFEFSHHAGVTLGNVYTYASLGALVRWGTHLMNDVGPPAITPAFPGIPAFRPGRGINWSLFFGAETRAVARNLFLDGNTDGDSHRVSKRPVVTDVVAGVALNIGNVRFSASNTYRGREFDAQPDAFRYGGVNITWYSQ